MKRALSLVMMFLFLHLSVGNKDLECANHSADSASAMAGMDMHTGNHHAGDAQSDRHHANHHGSHTAADQPCCSAMASCSLSIAASELNVAIDLPSFSARPIGREYSALLRMTAPETPPPRV